MGALAFDIAGSEADIDAAADAAIVAIHNPMDLNMVDEIISHIEQQGV